ncbi:MAG: hypothetical protein IPI67_38035 [Myxococcales bacterium]|nr:hypothetical protein [Myxococcales bacterium]
MSNSIFAIEIAARTYPNDPLRQRLHELIHTQAASQSQIQKRQLYYQAAQQLGMHFANVERGCWDYFPDHDKAIADFEMWSQGMITEEGARQGPAYDGPPRYLTFTMAFLMVHGSPTDRAIAQRCNIPQENLWRRDVFGYIVQAVASMDFADVQADVVYLIPGDDSFALTPQDLALPKFEYLRPIA